MTCLFFKRCLVDNQGTRVEYCRDCLIDLFFDCFFFWSFFSLPLNKKHFRFRVFILRLFGQICRQFSEKKWIKSSLSNCFIFPSQWKRIKMYNIICGFHIQAHLLIQDRTSDQVKRKIYDIPGCRCSSRIKNWLKKKSRRNMENMKERNGKPWNTNIVE